MTDNVPKDKRLFVRLEDEDLAYVQAEGKLLGLDASTWMRMMIRKLRLGVLVEKQLMVRLPDGTGVAFSELGRAPPSALAHSDAATVDYQQSHDDVADETLDTDDLVARKMREADQKGLTQPRAAQDDAGMGDEFEDFTGGIRPVGDRKSWKTGSPKDFRPE